GGEQGAPDLCPTPSAGVAIALVGVMSDQPSARIERRRLNERIVLALMQADDAHRMLPGDLPHFLVAGSLRSPQQERRGMQAVDAALDVTDVVTFFRLRAQGNELQRRIVHCRQAARAGNREVRRFVVLEQRRTERTTEV